LGLQGLWGGVLTPTLEFAPSVPLDSGEEGAPMKIEVGKAEIEFLESGGIFTEKPMSPHKGFNKEDEQTGRVSKFRVTTSDGLNMVFGLVYWPHANLEVRHLETINKSKYERLEGAGRLGVAKSGDSLWLAELRAMKYAAKERSTLNSVSLEELSSMVEEDAESLLIKHGALKLGTKGEIAADTSTRKNYLSFTCETGNETAIAVAYTVTRVLPIMHDFGLSEVSD
jgi:hypothetical protein